MRVCGLTAAPPALIVSLVGGAYIWNNTGEKATLVNPGGGIVDTCSWRPSPPSFKKC